MLEQNILLRAATRYPHYTIIMEDINIHVLNNNDISQSYLRLFNDYGCVKTVNCSTRPSNTGETCLDHALIRTTTLNHITTYVANTTIADHNSVIININNTSNNRNNQRNPKLTNKFNQSSFSDKLVMQDWNNITRAM